MLRTTGAKWSREDHHNRNSRGPARADLGGGFYLRSLLARRCTGNAGVARHFVAGDSALRKTLSARNRRFVCQFLPRAAFVGGGSRAVAAHGKIRCLGRQAFRGPETAFGGGDRSGVQSENSFSRRTHYRSRSAESPPTLGYYSRVSTRRRH